MLLSLGGDWGGCTVTAGGWRGDSLGFIRGDGRPELMGVASPARLSVDRATKTGGSLEGWIASRDGVVTDGLATTSCLGLKSRSLSGFGRGEMGLGGGCAGVRLP